MGPHHHPFSKWDDILRRPSPPPDLRYATAASRKEAEKVEQRFKKAWATADVKLAAH